MFDAELWVIMLALGVTIEQWKSYHWHGANTVAVSSDLPAAISYMPQLQPGPGQQLARRFNRRAQPILTHGIPIEIHWVLRHSGIARINEADHHTNFAPEATEHTTIVQPCTYVSNRARQIVERRSAVKAQWENDKCSNLYGYRLKG